MSVRLEIEAQGLERLNVAIDRLAGIDRSKELWDQLGQAVKGQVEGRITNEKSDPDGIAWTPWSEAYAKTRDANHSLMMDEGDLVDNFGYVYGDDFVEVGNVVDHAFFANNQREYLGISAENWNELSDAIEGFIEGLLQ